MVWEAQRGSSTQALAAPSWYPQPPQGFLQMLNSEADNLITSLSLYTSREPTKLSQHAKEARKGPAVNSLLAGYPPTRCQISCVWIPSNLSTLP